MEMKQYLTDIYKVFSSDETLLRLLYYKPVDASDNPLSQAKENILDKDNKWDIIEDHIRFTPTTTDMVDKPSCRLFFYHGRRSPNSSYYFADQDIVIDIFTHYEFNDIDLRLSWLCDHVNELMFDQRVTGLGKVRLVNGNNLGSPEEYIGYRLTYEIGSQN